MRQNSIRVRIPPAAAETGVVGGAASACAALPIPATDPVVLARVLHCRANVLVTGDVWAARSLFEGVCRDGPLHVLTSEEVNREGTTAFPRGAGRRNGWLLLERVEVLEAWAQEALLDLLESPDPGDLPRIHRVISTSEQDLTALVAEGRFSRPLYLRLGTLRMHLPRTATAANSLRAHGGGRK